MSKILTDSIISTLKDKTAIEDSGWVNLLLLNGYIGNQAQYRRILFPGGGGIVYLRGTVTPTNTNQQCAQLPASLRPSQNGEVMFSTACGATAGISGSTTRFSINSGNGGIYINDLPQFKEFTWVSINCSYMI